MTITPTRRTSNVQTSNRIVYVPSSSTPPREQVDDDLFMSNDSPTSTTITTSGNNINMDMSPKRRAKKHTQERISLPSSLTLSPTDETDLSSSSEKRVKTKSSSKNVISSSEIMRSLEKSQRPKQQQQRATPADYQPSSSTRSKSSISSSSDKVKIDAIDGYVVSDETVKLDEVLQADHDEIITLSNKRKFSELSKAILNTRSDPLNSKPYPRDIEFSVAKKAKLYDARQVQTVLEELKGSIVQLQTTVSYLKDELQSATETIRDQSRTISSLQHDLDSITNKLNEK